MKKRFNIHGTCYPHIHYMMDTSAKLAKVLEMVTLGEYFTISRPRQYGKTTMLHTITNALNQSEEYLPIRLTFEDIGDTNHTSDDAFAEMFYWKLTKTLKRKNKALYQILQDVYTDPFTLNTLSEAITDIVDSSPKKLVLLIDEVDASSSYLAFLKFLSLLRAKYLDRFSEEHLTFHSVILAGVHDIKNLKYKLRNPEEARYNSPWNIASEFMVDMGFTPKEIAPMLIEYGKAEGVTMDIPAITQRLYYYTSGHPFLVSRLCKIIVDNILPKQSTQEWNIEDVETAVQVLMKENNPNFDNLIKNIENNKGLYKLMYDVIINGAVIPYSPDESITQLGRVYGIFKINGRVKIHNRIYEQRLYKYLAVNNLNKLNHQEKYNFGNNFTTSENNLDHTTIQK